MIKPSQFVPANKRTYSKILWKLFSRLQYLIEWLVGQEFYPFVHVR